MTGNVLAPMRDGLNAELSRAWGSQLQAGAEQVRNQLFEGATLLRLTLMSGARVYPLVAWEPEALRRRLASSIMPILEPARVMQIMEKGDDLPSPLRVVGFVGVGRLDNMRTELAGLRALGRTVAMVRENTRLQSLALAEFDAQGTAVVEISTDGVEILVGGDAGRRAGSRLLPVWRRVYEEQLYGWARRTDEVPSY